MIVVARRKGTWYRSSENVDRMWNFVLGCFESGSGSVSQKLLSCGCCNELHNASQTCQKSTQQPRWWLAQSTLPVYFSGDPTSLLKTSAASQTNQEITTGDRIFKQFVKPNLRKSTNTTTCLQLINIDMWRLCCSNVHSSGFWLCVSSSRKVAILEHKIWPYLAMLKKAKKREVCHTFMVWISHDSAVYVIAVLHVFWTVSDQHKVALTCPPSCVTTRVGKNNSTWRIWEEDPQMRCYLARGNLIILWLGLLYCAIEMRLCVSNFGPTASHAVSIDNWFTHLAYRFPKPSSAKCANQFLSEQLRTDPEFRRESEQDVTNQPGAIPEERLRVRKGPQLWPLRIGKYISTVSVRNAHALKHHTSNKMFWYCRPTIFLRQGYVPAWKLILTTLAVTGFPNLQIIT